VHVAERRGDGEAPLTGFEALVGVARLRACCTARSVDVAVVDAVFLAAGDAELDLQRHADLDMRSR
jgi:hypothetical protein